MDTVAWDDDLALARQVRELWDRHILGTGDGEFQCSRDHAIVLDIRERRHGESPHIDGDGAGTNRRDNLLGVRVARQDLPHHKGILGRQGLQKPAALGDGVVRGSRCLGLGALHCWRIVGVE